MKQVPDKGQGTKVFTLTLSNAIQNSGDALAVVQHMCPEVGSPEIVSCYCT